MHHLTRVAFIALVAILITAGPASSAEAADGVQATFEGRTIDLANGWGPARACATIDEHTECFRNEAAMDRWITSEGDAAAQQSEDGVGALASCSSSLRLYDGTSYTGQILYLSTRSLWINLSGYGFDNLTSSYRIGACGAYLAENASGGGSWYPGNTSAGASASSMVTGWNNRVSSVYIQ